MGKETWENVSGSNVYLKTYDVKGQETVLHARPSQRISIDEDDRQMNQDLYVSVAHDPFANGSMVPVGATAKVFDSSEEYKEIASNPNIYSDSDLVKLFDLKGAAFKKKVEAIDGLSVIKRLLDLTESDDIAASMAQTRVIQGRFEELDPTPKMVISDPKDPLPAVGIE